VCVFYNEFFFCVIAKYMVLVVWVLFKNKK